MSIITSIVILVYAIGRADQLVNRKWPPVLTSTIEFLNYQTDATKFNLEEQELDVLIKFEVLPTEPDGEVRSWEAIDDKLGRVIAYEAKQSYPFHEPHYGNTVGDLDSSANLYLNPRTEAKYYPKVGEEDYIEIEDCQDDTHFKHISQIEKDQFFSNGRRKCLNMKEKSVSGGTVEDTVEHLIIIRWQHCDEYAEEEGLVCATGTDQSKFFDNIKITIEIGNTYIDYEEVETEKAIATRGTETLVVNSHLRDYKNTKGVITLSPNVGIFMDTWWSVYEEFDKEEYEYLSVDEFRQEPANPLIAHESDFGFTFVLQRSQRKLRHKRVVYSILDYLADLGGLNEAFMFILEPIFGLFLPALFTRKVLNGSYKYDSGKQTTEGFVSNST